jgi:RNA polymerase sigma-70 factor, ECF subfamily
MVTATVRNLSTPMLSEEFARLFGEHGRMIYRTAYSLTGSREDSQDILQTIFLRLWRQRLPEDFHKNPKGYLYRSAVNQSLDLLKARRRRRVISNVDFSQLSSQPANQTPDVHLRLYEAVAALGSKDREIVILRYVHDYTDAEIAEFLGRSRTAIAVALFRVRGRLRRILGDLENKHL